MSWLRAKGLAPIAIVVCASLVALLLKGMTEWACDLLVSASAGLAGRLKMAAPGVGAATAGAPGETHAPPRKRCPRPGGHHRWRKALPHEGWHDETGPR